MTEIQKVLKKGHSVASLDVTVFSRYHKGLISLSRCKELFFRNNDVPNESKEIITDEMFRKWLKQLGYYGGK